ncbi:MAG: diguanylate cyclase [Clostridiales bacterium]|nr:diguanylate cyclase [Clostridiales bacterium]
MSYLMNIAVDCIGIIILLLMFFNFGSQDIQKRETDDILFTVMLFVNIGLLSTDALMWILDGSVFWGARTLNILITAVYYILQPAMCMLWVLYCAYKLTESKRRVAKLVPICLLPMIFVLILTVISCFTPFVFYVDASNHYSRQAYYIVFVLLCFWYFFYAFILAMKVKKTEKKPKTKEMTNFLLLYPVFPAIGVIIQSIFFGISIIWIGSVISLLIVYFNLQNAKITSDPLTGVNNRRRFESFMEYKIRNRHGKSKLYLFMIDIDHFKGINDRYGHLCGDEAIKQTVKILVKAVKRQDFIARIGGDEFVVVGERDTDAEIFETITAIRREFQTFNETKAQTFLLSASIGYSILCEEETKSIDAILAEADTLMYQEKKLHHAAGLR